MDRLKNKVSIIFGGTSGIGKTITYGFFNENAIVIPTSRRDYKVKEVVDELAAKGNKWIDPLTADVTDKNQVEKICQLVFNEFGTIDIIVCTAGGYLKKPAQDIRLDEWNSIITTNLTGTFITNQTAGKYMLKQGHGSIINIGSLGSRVALSNTLPYCASKAGVNMITKCLSSEWCAKGVRVNTIVPGVFPTDLNRAALSNPVRMKNIIKRTPMRRLGNLKELIGAAVFLASDESEFVSGIDLPVDGGFLAYSGF